MPRNATLPLFDKMPELERRIQQIEERYEEISKINCSLMQAVTSLQSQLRSRACQTSTIPRFNGLVRLEANGTQR